MQKNQNSKGSHGKGKPAPSGAFTHRIREDGEIFLVRKVARLPLTLPPVASVAGSVRMRSTDSDRSVRATPKKARDASPPPQDDLWVVVRILASKLLLSKRDGCFAQHYCSPAEGNSQPGEILSNMASSGSVNQ
ncbi:hypothetical protein BASA83_009358 [Batrachochytrium salamandrivorans]|nr:hypothetical protein BASA83_009358 [Batrachochytrium salamandrivorans]